MAATSNNKRIAKNTVYLYIRTIVVLFVMLYSSRIVLQALGEEDLGIYNVVGGIVALMSFFQASLTKATSRFLTYELGNNSDDKKLRRVFSIAMTIHIFIAVLAILLGETIGTYALYYWTEIPENRQFAAFCVFQCALFIFCIHIIRVPYDSIIIAHENMSIYAYMSVLEAFLQLGLAFTLLYFSGDKLILYGSSLFTIAIILYISYYIYVRTRYKQYRFSFHWDKKYSTSILTFSSWSLVGTSANVATQQGVSLLFNNFVGLVANTALGLANQVNGAVARFVGNFTTAFNPQIIKLCAQKDYQQLHLLMNRASKFSFVLIWVMALPLIVNMDFVLHLWLGIVPKYTTEFCQLILICSVIDAVTGVYNTAVTATGNIKFYQISISISFLLDLVCAFLLLKMDFHPAIVFGSRIITRGIINMFIGWYFTSKQVYFNIKIHIKTVILPILITSGLSIVGAFYVTFYLEGWFLFFITSIVCILITIFSTFIFILDKSEKNVIFKLIMRFF